MFIPELFHSLKGYTKKSFFSDLAAGVIVGIVAIPLAIAFAIASGTTPDKGLLTAIVAGFLISVLGGSRVQIGGPTGAFIVVIYGIVQQYGIEGLIVATILAGIMLVMMGLAQLGNAIKFIPHTVVVGFTSGIALIIFSSQVNDLLGLGISFVPADFLEKWEIYFIHLDEINYYAFFISLFTIGVMTLWPRVSRKIPGSFIAIIISAILVSVFHWPVATIGSRFGELPHGLPWPHWPHVDLSMIEKMIKPAFTIAMLGAIESLLSAVVADGMIGHRHKSNMELVAQGTANVVSGLLGGIPATGAIARTVTNIKNGGNTPIAGVVHAITIFLALLFFGRWIKMIPLACLAGILVIVSYHMSEWRSFLDLIKTGRGAAMVLLTTFFITIFFDLTLAIEIGMVFSMMIFMNRMARLTKITVSDDTVDLGRTEEGTPMGLIQLPQGVEMYEINGPFFFGVAHKFEEAMRIVSRKPKVRILRLRNVLMIDSTGLHALRGFFKKCKLAGIHLIITGLHVQPLNEMIKSQLYDMIGEENVFGNIKDAVHRSEEFLKG